MRAERASIPPAPSSGFYPAAPRAKLLEGHEGALPRARVYLEGLLRTGDLFLRERAELFELGSLFDAIEATLPVRALVLVESDEGAVRARTTHATERIDDAGVERIAEGARALFAYLADRSETLADRREEGIEIALPLVDDDGAVFALMLASLAGAASEPDVAFLDAVGAQLGLTLARGRRDASVRLAEARTASELARQRAARAAVRGASFLADALTMLNATPDPTRDLTALARFVSRRVAQGCVFAIGPIDALRRTEATRLPPEGVDAAVARLVPRTFVLRETLFAASTRTEWSCPTATGWRADAEAEAMRRELGLEWLACVPIPDRDGSLHGALLLLGRRRTSPVDSATIDRFARLLGDAFARTRSYRSGLRALEDRDRVLSMVAHELRQPLNALLLNVSSVLGRPPAAGERRRAGRGELERMKRALLRLARLTRDLLDVATIEARAIRIECARVSVAEAIDEACDLLRAIAADHGITLRGDADVFPPVWADPERVQQVLLNLIGNAIKFTPPGGSITVGARMQGSAVEVSVSDTGPGIPEADRASVFDRFWQARSTASQGSGIGLAITKAIVEAHGGRIRVESANGAGTTFAFTLPVASAA